MAADGRRRVCFVDCLRECGQYAVGAGHGSSKGGGDSRFPGRKALAALHAVLDGKPRSGADRRHPRCESCLGYAEGDRGHIAAVFYTH